MEKVKRAVLDAGVLVEGHFVFADGAHATKKLEMDHLWNHESSLDVVLRALGEAKGLPPADVVVGVPEGGQRLAEELYARGYISIKPTPLERVPHGEKREFRFTNTEDAEKARKATSIRIYEDVVTTLSSIAGAAKLFSSNQQIHSLAIWRRGTVKEEYRGVMRDHYLIEEPIESFSASLCPVCQKT